MGSAGVGQLSQIALENDLFEAGDKIKMPLSTDQLIISLENVNRLLVQVWQRPPKSTCTSLIPIMQAMVSHGLLHHADLNVQVTMASCFAQIARISAPEPIYCDDLMREVFRILMVAFRQLSSESGRNYLKAFDVLKTVEQVKLPLMLLDIGPEELIHEMFQIFLNNIRSTHPLEVFKHMETIMTTVIKESDGISFEMLRPLLSSVRMENKDASPSWELGLKVFMNCAAELQHSLKQALKLRNLNVDDYADIISSICQTKFNKVSDQSDTPAGDVDEESDGKEDAGALSIKKGRKHGKDKDLKPSKVKDFESSSTLKRKKMLDKMKGSSDAKKTSKTEAAGSSIGKGKKKRIPRDSDLEEKDESLYRKGEQTGREEDIGETTSQKHVTKEVSNQKGDAKPGTVEPKRKKNKTQKLKRPHAEELINARIKVWWPMDKRFYTGTVVEFDPAAKKHKILYDDNEEEILNLRTEVWQLVDELLPEKQETDQTSPVKKAVRTEEKVVKKKKTPLKKQHATSSSMGSKSEGQIMGKLGNSSATEEAEREEKNTTGKEDADTTMIEADRISEDVTKP